MSPTQMEYFWHKKPEKTLETIAGLIAQCREKCGEVEFIADDACRSESGVPLPGHPHGHFRRRHGRLPCATLQD